MIESVPLPGAYDPGRLRELTGNCLRPGGVELTSRALALCGFATGDRVLDLGCGAGASLAVLSEAGCRPLGLDLSPGPFVEARAVAPVLRADMVRLPLAPDCLDGIICECALSLVMDKKAVLDECARVLKIGGRLLLSDLARRESPWPGKSQKPAACSCAFPCATGAADLAYLDVLLRESGFTILAAEDHSNELRNLAASIVWHFGSLSVISAQLPQICDNRAPSEPVRNGGGKLEYWIIIACKGHDHATTGY